MFDEEQPAVRAQNTAHFAKCPAGIGHRAKRPRGYNSIKAGAFKWQRFRRSLQQLDRDACAFNQLCCALKQLRTRIERYNVARQITIKRQIQTRAGANFEHPPCSFRCCAPTIWPQALLHHCKMQKRRKNVLRIKTQQNLCMRLEGEPKPNLLWSRPRTLPPIQGRGPPRRRPPIRLDGLARKGANTNMDAAALRFLDADKGLGHESAKPPSSLPPFPPRSDCSRAAARAPMSSSVST